MFRGNFASKSMTLPDIDHVIYVAAHFSPVNLALETLFCADSVIRNQRTVRPRLSPLTVLDFWPCSLEMRCASNEVTHQVTNEHEFSPKRRTKIDQKSTKNRQQSISRREIVTKQRISLLSWKRGEVIRNKQQTLQVASSRRVEVSRCFSVKSSVFGLTI